MEIFLDIIGWLLLYVVYCFLFALPAGAFVVWIVKGFWKCREQKDVDMSILLFVLLIIIAISAVYMFVFFVEQSLWATILASVPILFWIYIFSVAKKVK